VTRVGDFHGSDRGWSATRVRHSHAARGEKRGGDCVGADRGGWSRVGDKPPSGAEWGGGHVRVGCQGGRENGEG
jgi:hypothetical protein